MTFTHGSKRQLLTRMLCPCNDPRFTHKHVNRIGTGAFEYDFGALDNSDNPLARTYGNIAYVSTLAFRISPFIIYNRSETEQACCPPKGHILFRNVTRWLPGGLLTWLAERGQKSSQIKLRQNRTEAHRVARILIDQKREELRDGTSRRDVLSLLGLSP